MRIAEDIIKCGKCHNNKWKNCKCTKCGEDIKNSYIGNEEIYKELFDIVQGIK